MEAVAEDVRREIAERRERAGASSPHGHAAFDETAHDGDAAACATGGSSHMAEEGSADAGLTGWRLRGWLRSLALEERVAEALV